jgi:phospholipid/cholesterol/gamma-HCH transport system substrate-binding protein
VRRVEIDAADPSRILVTFRVSDRTPVRTDTRASIVDATGAVTRHLALRSGRRDAPALPAGREVTTEVGPTLEEMLIGLTSVVQRMDTLLDAAVPLAHSDLFSRLERTSRRLDLMTAAVVRTSAQWGPGLVRAAGRLDTVLTRSDSLLAALNAATPELRSASGEALGMLQDTRALVGQLRAGASQGGGVDELMRNLTLATDNLSRLAAKLERNPASLLKTQRPMPKTAGPKLND